MFSSLHGTLRRTLSLSGLLSAAACIEPSFVSLGSNDVAVLSPSAVDAGDAAADMPFVDLTMAPPQTPAECAGGPAQDALTSPCEARSVSACPVQSGLTVQQAIDDMLTTILLDCQLRTHQLQVPFIAGCATRFELSDDASDGAATGRDCVRARLEGQTYDCAQSVACGIGRTFGIPTSSVQPDWY